MIDRFEQPSLIQSGLKDIPGHALMLLLSYLPNPIDGERAVVRSHFTQASDSVIESDIHAGNQDRRDWRVQEIKGALQRSIRRG